MSNKEFHQSNHSLLLSNDEVTDLAALQANLSNYLTEDHEGTGERKGGFKIIVPLIENIYTVIKFLNSNDSN